MSNELYLKVKSRFTIMLIDDEERLLDALCRYLNSKGFNVLTAKSTAIAINLLTNFKPDILIVDVMMPEKNGYDFIYWLKKDKDLKNIPFIFLTAKGMTQDRIKGYKLGCQGYITKPFDPEELISVIENIISKNEDFNNIEQIKNEIKSIRLILENVNSNYIQFTPREKDILLEIINGQSNANIAKIKEISIRNVEKYVTRILYKTNCKNRIELIKFSYKFYKQLRANDGNRTRE